MVTGDGDTTNDGVDNDGNNAAGEEESNNAKRKRLKQQHKKVPGSICYKCGSTDHRIQICPKIKKYITPGQTKIDFGKIGNLPYANCYVCNKSGHLASFCPESKNGVFPLGGSCRECGSVDHFAADCPTKKKENDGGGGSEDGEDSNSVTIEQYLEDPVEGDGAKEKDARKQSAKKKRKVVNF